VSVVQYTAHFYIYNYNKYEGLVTFFLLAGGIEKRKTHTHIYVAIRSRLNIFQIQKLSIIIRRYLKKCFGSHAFIRQSPQFFLTRKRVEGSEWVTILLGSIRSLVWVFFPGLHIVFCCSSRYIDSSAIWSSDHQLLHLFKIVYQLAIPGLLSVMK
jgi:hypothetical protein